TWVATLLFLHLCEIASAQQKTLTGTVLSDDNSPVSGASVLLKKGTTGTQTDATGHFTISALTGEILVISAVGFSPQEVKVGNSNSILVTLQKGTTKLDEVVVTALGIKK